jgi:CHAT domain-containing protein/Tfp pilus assembly protein PilF
MSTARKGSWRRRWWASAAAALLGAALLGGAPQALQAQPRAASPKTAAAKDLEEAERLGAEGEKLRNEGKLAAALPLAERSLSLREKVLGPKHLTVAQSLNDLGLVYYEMDDHARALALHQRALDIREKALGPEHPDVAQSLNNLAHAYGRMSDYARALSLNQRALDIREKALGKDHLYVSHSLQDLGIIYYYKGEYARYKALLQRALDIKEKALGPEDPDVARSLNELAILDEVMGDYVQALALHQRSLAIWEKALGPDHPDVVPTLNNLANVYNKMGEYARAVLLFQRALAIWEKVFGPEHPAVARLLNNLANVYMGMGEHAQAVRLHLRALSIREKALGPEHPEVANSLNNLANVYKEMGDYAQALPLLERALGIFEKVLGPEHSDAAEARCSLAEVYRGRGELPRAEPFYQRALAIWEKALGPDHPDVARTLDGLAALAEARGDLAGALPFAERAAEIREKNLLQILPTGAETHKRDNLAQIADDVDHNLWRAFHTENPGAARLALTTLLRRKGRALDATAESIRVLRARLGPDEQKLFDDLQAVRSQRSALVLRGPDPMPLDQYKALLDELLSKDQKLDEQISQKSDAFRSSEQPITLGAVKAALPPGAALVEWSVYRPFNPKGIGKKGQFGIPRYGACIQKTQGEPRCIDLGEALAIDAAVTALRKGLSRAASPDVKALGRDLHQKVMAPLQKLLGETRWLFLAPDGALHLIPFAALVDEDGRFVAQNHALTYLTSGRDLMRLANAKPPAQEKPVIFSAPDFDAAGAAAPAAPKSESPADTERSTRSTDFGSITFSPLLGTAREARALAGTLGDTRLLLGPDATETAFKALHSPRLLHIATHGFFLPDQKKIEGKGEREDPLLRSGLALAGANGHKSGKEDGVLTALEVTGEDLYGTDLVVLSACETGVGEVKNGDGVYGLRRALVVSGARTQVMSLWKVDDQATVAMMKAYYARLKAGEGRSEAMRQVQLSMMAEPTTAAPYYWASFIVSGDWATLDGKPVVPNLLRVPPSPRGCACAMPGEAPASGQAAWAAIAALGLGLRAYSGRRSRPRRVPVGNGPPGGRFGASRTTVGYGVNARPRNQQEQERR